AEGGRRAGINILHVDDTRVRVEAALASLVDDGVVDEREEVSLLGGCGLIAVVKEVADDGDLRGVAAVVAAADGARGIGRTVLVAMQEDVPFNPGVRAIEIKLVIAAAGENVVDELNDGRRAVAAGKIDHVIVAN